MRTMTITVVAVGVLVFGTIASLGWATDAVYVPGVEVVEWVTPDGPNEFEIVVKAIEQASH